ncbi:QRFP-like peptide receptor [Oculina patagonica]
MTSTPSAYKFPPTVNASMFHPKFNDTQVTPTNQTTAGGGSSSHVFEAILVSLMAFVIIAGLIGNVMVIATIASRRSMWTPCNLFITNIAIADLLVAIILTPLRMAELFIGWPLGEFLCRFFGPLQDVIVCISAVTHTVIALERHRGIVTPFKPKLSLRRAKITIAIIAIACYLVIGLPLALVLKQVESKKGVKYCRARWPVNTSRIIYEVYLVAVFIFVPLVTQTATYVKVIATIKKEDASAQTISRSGTVEQRRNQIRKKAHLVKMLIILVVVFQVCFIPRGIFILVKEFTSASYKATHNYSLTIINFVSIILFYLKHVLNPFILFAMSAEFKKNCFPCRTVCFKNLDFVSSVSRYISQNSRSPNSDTLEEEKELKKLCDVSSPDMHRGEKEKESSV